MTEYPHRLEAYYLAPLAQDRFHITWFQREGYWEAHRSLPGLNQLGRVYALDGDMLQVFRNMRDIMNGRILVTRELEVINIPEAVETEAVPEIGPHPKKIGSC